MRRAIGTLMGLIMAAATATHTNHTTRLAAADALGHAVLDGGGLGEKLFAFAVSAQLPPSESATISLSVPASGMEADIASRIPWSSCLTTGAMRMNRMTKY